jgi:hypothetical protein
MHLLLAALVLGALSSALSMAESESPVDSVPERPTTFEYADLLLDVANATAARSGSVVLVVARLGVGERSTSLNRRRLASVRKFVSQRKSYTATFYYAEGDRVDGLGRVEIYVLGKLVDEPETGGTIRASRNAPLQLWMSGNG